YKLVPWIEDLVKQKGYTIAPQAAVLMAEYLGTDLSKVANETEKLLLNVPQGTTINTDHIQKNIGISKEYNVFELQKALGTRNIFKCNQIVNYFADNPKSNPMVMVMANLNTWFTKVLKYHYLQNKADAAKELGISPFFVKDFELAARNYNLGKVVQVISYLRDYDLKSKGLDSTGNVSDGELLKELVFKITH
ncbi:MAG: DNA polymerase III subunit delta, partial [Pedobacter sp.]